MMKKTHSKRRKNAMTIRNSPGMPLMLRARASSNGSTLLDSTQAIGNSVATMTICARTAV